MAASKLTTLTTCDGVSFDYDVGFWKKGINKEQSIFKNTAPAEFLKGFKEYGINCVVFPMILKPGEHSSDSWGGKDKSKEARCPMNNIYIVVPNAEGKPEYRQACFTLTRIGIGADIKEPKDRFFKKAGKVITNVNIWWRPPMEGFEPSKDDARRKEYLTAVKIYYDCLEQHVDNFKEAIEEAYVEKYVPEGKKKPSARESKKAAQYFIENTAKLGTKFIHKVSPMYKKVDDDKKEIIEGSMSLKIDFNTPKEKKDKWPNTYPFVEGLNSGGEYLNAITDNIVDKALLDKYKELPSKERIRQSTVPNVTEENIHELGLFKRGAQITTNSYHGLLAHSTMGLSCKVSFKKDKSDSRWIIIDASKAVSAGGGDNPDDVIADANDSDTEHDDGEEKSVVDKLLDDASDSDDN